MIMLTRFKFFWQSSGIEGLLGEIFLIGFYYHYHAIFFYDYYFFFFEGMIITY